MTYLLLATGFEETEAIAPLDLLRRAGVEVLTVGVSGRTVRGSHGICIQADIELGEVDLTALDMVILPGGMGGVASVRACPAALELLRFAWENGKWVAAICAGPTVLADLGITDGRAATCYPGQEPHMGAAQVCTDRPWVQDGHLITGASAGCAISFGLALVAALKGQETADAIKAQIVIR